MFHKSFISDDLFILLSQQCSARVSYCHRLLVQGDRLVCKSVGEDFDSKQSRESTDLSLTCHPSPSLTTFAFRSREVRPLLLDLVPYGGTDTLGMFPLFLQRTADVMVPSHSVVFSAACSSG